MDSNLEIPFTKIVRKNRKNRCDKKEIPTETRTELTAEDKTKIIRHVEQDVEELFQTDFFHSVRALLKESLEILEKSTIERIVCLGLGCLCENLTPKYQLALLLCVRKIYGAQIEIYDPKFNKDDIEILEKFNLRVSHENFEGKYRVNEQITLFFLPHCPKQLTNNILWINWGMQLSNCILMCNSFSKIEENNPMNSLRQNSEYILNILPHTTELGVANTFKFYDVFNDTCIHIFPNLKLLPPDFWTINAKEPKYSENDCEFIRNITVLEEKQ